MHYSTPKDTPSNQGEPLSTARATIGDVDMTDMSHIHHEIICSEGVGQPIALMTEENLLRVHFQTRIGVEGLFKALAKLGFTDMRLEGNTTAPVTSSPESRDESSAEIRPAAELQPV